MTIHDEFSALPISSQRRYQMRAHRNAKCIICGKPSPGKSLCDLHRVRKKYRLAMQRVAHQAVVAALSMGWIRRQNCEICGKTAHAHHEDYLRPLEVRWLCPKHTKGFELWAEEERAKRGEPQEWE